jgi:hypothetical protein
MESKNNNALWQHMNQMPKFQIKEISQPLTIGKSSPASIARLKHHQPPVKQQSMTASIISQNYNSLTINNPVAGSKSAARTSFAPGHSQTFHNHLSGSPGYSKGPHFSVMNQKKSSLNSAGQIVVSSAG